ncbi:MAG: ArsR family transcriptional regulator [Planctomycetales bacterium 71-10]|nr:MAG: ArsR family transcriptional regulator [Planctomycetales bacterium 71-10]
MDTQKKRRFKARLFGEFARIGKALGNPHRLQIIEVLAQGERTVEQLADELGCPVANASQHLQVLKAAMLVTIRREGLYAHYSLADPKVFRAWQAIRELGEARLEEVESVVSEYLEDRSKLEAVDAAELKRRLQDVVILDVRSRAEYESGHIRGARNVPHDELEARLRDLPRDAEIVAYCRGPYCVFADEVVAALQAKGYRARRLAEGYPDWRQRGFPVSTGISTEGR